MRHVAQLVDAARCLPARWQSAGPALAAGRSIVAVATMIELAFTSNAALFGDAGDFTGSAHCAGVGAASIWCVSVATTHGFALGKILSIMVLVTAASGYRPRWTCIPHWYVAFSLESAIVVSDGGDGAASIAALLLIPICLGDIRNWQWRRPTELPPPAWRGTAMAGQLVLRVQVAVIYATAAVSKLNDFTWRHGYAMYFVAFDPIHGLPPPARAALSFFLGSYWSVAALSWSVIVVQILIAVAVLGSVRFRLVALFLVTGLHVAIAVLLSLPSFGLTMIGLAAIALSGGPVGREPDQPAYPADRASVAGG
jgi:antimicrobial peptide system SdpB family protein